VFSIANEELLSIKPPFDFHGKRRNKAEQHRLLLESFVMRISDCGGN
jgi:hypothetical protein